ncbi:hypothetical protein HPB50_006127 [Hyalomma asiaticum]|uniref:Uncharacterized protein n=1 Tax=Hyalomma asiaticum TaxID=266040 RepID=A0ACB7SS04_HYAAI|nr:hypothetical protein HPB50_006127 [Hyalomma asiaticum]
MHKRGQPSRPLKFCAADAKDGRRVACRDVSWQRTLIANLLGWPSAASDMEKPAGQVATRSESVASLIRDTPLSLYEGETRHLLRETTRMTSFDNAHAGSLDQQAKARWTAIYSFF